MRARVKTRVLGRRGAAGMAAAGVALGTWACSPTLETGRVPADCPPIPERATAVIALPRATTGDLLSHATRAAGVVTATLDPGGRFSLIASQPEGGAMQVLLAEALGAVVPMISAPPPRPPNDSAEPAYRKRLDDRAAEERAACAEADSAARAGARVVADTVATRIRTRREIRPLPEGAHAPADLGDHLTAAGDFLALHPEAEAEIVITGNVAAAPIPPRRDYRLRGAHVVIVFRPSGPGGADRQRRLSDLLADGGAASVVWLREGLASPTQITSSLREPSTTEVK